MCEKCLYVQVVVVAVGSDGECDVVWALCGWREYEVEVVVCGWVDEPCEPGVVGCTLIGADVPRWARLANLMHEPPGVRK